MSASRTPGGTEATDPDLALVAAVWAGLPEAVRRRRFGYDVVMRTQAALIWIAVVLGGSVVLSAGPLESRPHHAAERAFVHAHEHSHGGLTHTHGHTHRPARSPSERSDSLAATPREDSTPDHHDCCGSGHRHDLPLYAAASPSSKGAERAPAACPPPPPATIAHATLPRRLRAARPPPAPSPPQNAHLRTVILLT